VLENNLSIREVGEWKTGLDPRRERWGLEGNRGISWGRGGVWIFQIECRLGCWKLGRWLVGFLGRGRSLEVSGKALENQLWCLFGAADLKTHG